MTVKEFKIACALKTISITVKIELAYNSRTAKTILSTLSKENDWRIRRYVADNLNAPASALATLATDKSTAIKLRVAANPSTSNKTLIEMLDDKNEHIKNIAQKTINKKRKIARKIRAMQKLTKKSIKNNGGGDKRD